MSTGWISTKERLPEEWVPVLVFYESGKIRIAEITGVVSKTAFSFEGLYGAATHWMPLPEPPAET